MNAPSGMDSNLPSPGLKHPGRWLWLILLVPVLVGLTRLHFDVEVFDLLPSNLEAVEGLKLYQQYFANARELIITVKGKDAEQTEAAAQALAEHLRPVTNLVAKVTWEPPWLEHPEQAAELMAYLWLNQPPELFSQLATRLAPDKLSGVLADTREQLTTSMSPQDIARLSYDPYGLTQLPESAAGATPSFGQGNEMFSSRDGRFRIVFVQALSELRTYRDCQRWLTQVSQVATNAVASLPGVKLGYTGRPAFVAEVAGGMEHDITTSVGGTAAIIAVLFWLAHRRIKPMLWLLTLLALILGSTLALGGLIFGKINVVSMGFAAILLGLAVDYAVVHYQEALAHPNLSIPQIRHAIAPSIFWAAVTTISAFLVLNFGGLPGLGQLGTLVGMGVALAATIMIFEFLPPLFPGRQQPPSVEAIEPPHSFVPREQNAWWTTAGFLITAAVLVTVCAILAFGLPRVDPTANALRPRHSQAYAAVDEIQTQLSQTREPLWLLVGGPEVADVGQKLEQSQEVLSNAVAKHLISSFTLPTPLWPNPSHQAQNRATAAALASERPAFRQAAQTNGFAANAVALTERVLDTWDMASRTHTIFWPQNPMSRWIFDKFAAQTPTNYFALGLINPTRDGGRTEALSILGAQLPRDQVWLSGWELLGSAIFSRVKTNMWKVVAPMVFLVLLSLYLAFRRWPEIALSLAVLLLSGLVLLAVMRLCHWSWNLLNLMAIPLVLGTGVDYSIFMQLALRRFRGDRQMAYQSVGRALLLCGGTAIAGFGSLAWSSNAGMASLGQVCAVGVASNMLIAIFLLPLWWGKAFGSGLLPTSAKPDPSGPAQPPAGPSTFYRSELWRLGQILVRFLPKPVMTQLGLAVAWLYSRVARHRRRIVIENLLPALQGEEKEAHAKADALFRHFAYKLTDLWRYEAGLPIEGLFGATSGWEHFEQAQAQKRGVLLVTPHLGNWEFGGPALSRRGVTLQVITLAEPGDALTAMRQASRARWNIETLVIRDDPFAFLEVIRRLEAGATVALLIDRPPPPTAVTVNLFGRPFSASIAAAELARASGCVVLPVYIPRAGEVYEAHILPPVAYERAALRDRAARQQFTQELIRIFEPMIHRHLEQWYHFVPVWPQSTF